MTSNSLVNVKSEVFFYKFKVYTLPSSGSRDSFNRAGKRKLFVDFSSYWTFLSKVRVLVNNSSVFWRRWVGLKEWKKGFHGFFVGISPGKLAEVYWQQTAKITGGTPVEFQPVPTSNKLEHGLESKENALVNQYNNPGRKRPKGKGRIFTAIEKSNQ